MIFDYQKLMNEIRSNSFTFLSSISKDMLSFWYGSDISYSKLPVVFISIELYQIDIDDGNISFFSKPPTVLNDFGILTDDCWNTVKSYLDENPKTYAYGLISQPDDSHILVQYEDLKSCFDLIIPFTIEEDSPIFDSTETITETNTRLTMFEKEDEPIIQ